MMRILMLTLGTALLGAAPAMADEKPPAATQPAATTRPAAGVEPRKPLCPVTNKPIDRAVVSAFRGRKVYFADAAARSRFDAAPEEYFDAMEVQWPQVKPLRTQTRCPVTGKLPDRQFASPRGAEDVYFATAAAKAEWDKDSKPYIAALEKSYIWQTDCVVCGHDINLAISVLADGREIYSACEGCIEAIKEDKPGHLAKLDRQIERNRALFAIETQSAAKGR